MAATIDNNGGGQGGDHDNYGGNDYDGGGSHGDTKFEIFYDIIHIIVIIECLDELIKNYLNLIRNFKFEF